MEVWRGTKTKSGSLCKQKLVAAGQFPAHLITTVQVQLLMPFGDDDKTFIGTWLRSIWQIGVNLFYFLFLIRMSLFFIFF